LCGQRSRRELRQREPIPVIFATNPSSGVHQVPLHEASQCDGTAEACCSEPEEVRVEPPASNRHDLAIVSTVDVSVSTHSAGFRGRRWVERAAGRTVIDAITAPIPARTRARPAAPAPRVTRSRCAIPSGGQADSRNCSLPLPHVFRLISHSIIYAFDLLWLDGRRSPRTAAARAQAPAAPARPHRGSRLLYIDHVGRRGYDLFRVVCDRDMEGILGRLAHAPYLTHPSSWVNVITPTYSQLRAGTMCSHLVPLTGLADCQLRIRLQRGVFFRRRRTGYSGARVRLVLDRTSVCTCAERPHSAHADTGDGLAVFPPHMARATTSRRYPPIYAFTCQRCAAERVRLRKVSVDAFELRCDNCGHVWSQVRYRHILRRRCGRVH
jgi:predicted Zn finger-like uncharacterized protein